MGEPTTSQDLLVIGGGINGVGCAADAAGRGLRVTLCEMNDLAWGTSSASSKLIHGGLRYLEHYDFKLVREALKERSILLQNAPHLVKPLPFILPQTKSVRPAWLLKLGLFCYDHLLIGSGATNILPKSTTMSATELASLDLQPQFNFGFKYYDCKTDDSRLVVTVALLAQQQGATILTRTKVVAVKAVADRWEVTVTNQNTGHTTVILTKAIINAAGPWAAIVAQDILQIKLNYKLNLVKGSHILVPRLFTHEDAFILQTPDQRVVFVIPYLDKFHLIGTTEVNLTAPASPEQLTISPNEKDYLCTAVNTFFRQPISAADIVHSYCGVRALYTRDSATCVNPTKLTRDYVIDTYLHQGKLPILSILGGKLTTYRSLAETLISQLTPYFPKLGAAWTQTAILPGGEVSPNLSQQLQLQHQHPWLSASLLQHLVNNYGSRATAVIAAATSLADLGQHFGGDLYAREVDFLIANEWAQTAEDILWRRSKHGLFLTTTGVVKLKAYLRLQQPHLPL